MSEQVLVFADDMILTHNLNIYIFLDICVFERISISELLVSCFDKID